MKYCWKCNSEWNDVGQPAVKATCERCNEDLHACRNCINFDEQTAAQCKERGIEPVLNKERANFCEEFQFARTSWRPKCDSDKVPLGDRKQPNSKPAPLPTQTTRAKWDQLFKKNT